MIGTLLFRYTAREKFGHRELQIKGNPTLGGERKLEAALGEAAGSFSSLWFIREKILCFCLFQFGGVQLEEK